MDTTITNSTDELTALKPLSEATIANLMLVTQDPIDAMRLAADVYAMAAYSAERRLCEHTGARRPVPPRPISKFLRGFISHLKSWFETMAHSLRPDELQRLERIGETLMLRLNDEPGLILEEVFTVVTMAPPFAVAWLRSHFDEIEAKVVS